MPNHSSNLSVVNVTLTSDHVKKKNCENNPRCLYGLGEGKEVSMGCPRRRGRGRGGVEEREGGLASGLSCLALQCLA